MQSTHSPYSNTYEDDDAHRRRANDEWRHDPARREAARARAEEVRAAHIEAHALLQQAVSVLRAVGPLDPDQDAMTLRASRDLGVALVRFDRDAKIIGAPLNETAIGNRAAFGYAWPAGPARP